MVVPCPERAEEILLAGDMPCPRCRGVLRPFGTGRTRTVRGVGADTVTVTPRRARCADCQVTQILLPTELLVRRADSTAAIGNALVAKGRRRRVPQHRRPVRAARVNGPPMVAGRPGAARAVAVPTRREQRRAGRPGIAGPAGDPVEQIGDGAALARHDDQWNGQFSTTCPLLIATGRHCV